MRLFKELYTTFPQKTVSNCLKYPFNLPATYPDWNQVYQQTLHQLLSLSPQVSLLSWSVVNIYSSQLGRETSGRGETLCYRGVRDVDKTTGSFLTQQQLKEPNTQLALHHHVCWLCDKDADSSWMKTQKQADGRQGGPQKERPAWRKTKAL